MTVDAKAKLCSKRIDKPTVNNINISWLRAELRTKPIIMLTMPSSKIEKPKSGPITIRGTLSLLYQKANILPSLRGLGFSLYAYVHKVTISFTFRYFDGVDLSFLSVQPTLAISLSTDLLFFFWA